MLSTHQVYEHSGGLGSALFLAPVAGIATGFVGALVYSAASIYIPIVGIVSILGVLGLGWLVGHTVAKVAHVGHSRNVLVTRITGFFVGTVTLYFAWVFFEWILIRQSDPSFGIGGLIGLLISPLAVWEIANEIAQTGWYSIGSSDSNISGIPLWITWIGEACLLIGLSTVYSSSSIADAVYCEQRQDWVPDWQQPVYLRFPFDTEKLEKLASPELEPLDQLESLEAASDEETPRIDVEVWSWPEDQRTAAYRVQIFNAEIDKEGRLQVELRHLTPKILASSNDLNRLAALAAREPAPLPDPEPSDEAEREGEGEAES